MRSRSRALTVHSAHCYLRVRRALPSCVCAKILASRYYEQTIMEVLKAPATPLSMGSSQWSIHIQAWRRDAAELIESFRYMIAADKHSHWQRRLSRAELCRNPQGSGRFSAEELVAIERLRCRGEPVVVT